MVKHQRPLIWSLLLLLVLYAEFPSGRTSARSQDLSPRQLGNPSGTDDEETSGQTLAPDLVRLAQADPTGRRRVRVIIQAKPSRQGRLDELLRCGRTHVKRSLYELGMFVAELPIAAAADAAATDEVSYISLDREVETLGHVENTTGATDARKEQDEQHGDDGGDKQALDGSGIGIAILDTGLFNAHFAFQDTDQTSRIAANVDFTGAGITTTDPYGHGTFVAGLACGNGHGNHIEDKYEGIAPNARIINLRVLDSQGRGTTSSVLSALDWVIRNRAAYNIRVVNMSLGAYAVDSYKTDPLCRAVRRLVDNGIVVVAAAGNNGKNGSGQKIYGLIHSPGNEPSAITVGAGNSYGTDIRSDDTVTTYSSRGPTRSYWADANSVRHYDNLIKPDLIAPGNKLISAQSPNSTLITTHPELAAVTNDDPRARMMYLSGTSASAPVVSGAVALMLQANPNLTPNLVKAILMYTAQPLAGFNQLEQGAGELNIEGAVRLAGMIRSNLGPGTPAGSPLLTTGVPPVPVSQICGHFYLWGQGIILGYTYASGPDLVTRYQAIYGTGHLLSDGYYLASGHLLADNTLLTAGVTLGGNILTSNGYLLGDGYPFLSLGMLLGDGYLADGHLLADGQLLSDGFLLGDGFLLSDAITQASGAQIQGDPGGMSAH